MSQDYQDYYGDAAVWEKFNTYTDTDGFYFLGCFSDCSKTDVFKWTYYPPGIFKILIYFPEYDHFVVSGETYERYAFDSYYTVDAAGLDIRSVTVISDIAAVIRTYDFTWEILSLLCRIIVTIAVELGIAWLFGFRTKKQILVIAITNVATQTVLNILLNIINYNRGGFAFVFNYVWMELVVLVIEGLIFARLLSRYVKDPTQKTRPWLYAATANAASFAAGMLIAKWMPGIF